MTVDNYSCPQRKKEVKMQKNVGVPTPFYFFGSGMMFRKNRTFSQQLIWMLHLWIYNKTTFFVLLNWKNAHCSQLHHSNDVSEHNGAENN